MHVTHVSSDKFRVEYTFPDPATRLAFLRRGHGVRLNWQALDDARIEHNGDKDELVSAAPRRTWTIELPVEDVFPEKDYRTFYRFTDGGTLFYTGHLAVGPLHGKIVFTPLPGESFAAHGEPALETDGTYVYFGAQKPAETPEFIGIVDRGFPSAIRAKIDELLPKLFRRMSDGLGRPASAAEKPLLFATYRHLAPGVRDMGGGVMPPRVVSFDFGMDTDQVGESLRLDIEHILAHEIAHLWNGDLYSSSDESESWMKEGGAEALAFQALRAFGELDDAAYRERFSTALSLCVLALAEGEPVAVATRPGRSRDFYTCGSTIALLSEASVVKHDPKSGLMPFLKEVYAGPNNHYDGERYVKTLQVLGDIEVAHVVERIARKGMTDPAYEIPSTLRRAGVELVASEASPEVYEIQAGRFALRALLQPTCANALSLDGTYGVRATIQADGVCGEAVKGDQIETVAGLPISRRGGSAWDAGFMQCKAGGTIAIGRKGKPALNIPCAPSPRRRASYFTITKAP